MSPVLLESRPIPVRHARRAVGIAVAALFALSLVGLFDLVRIPAVVDHLSIDNETRDDLTVSVGSGDGALLPVAVVEAGRSERVTDVLDQGDRWVVVLNRAGERVGVIRVDRSQLEADGWRVVVPEGFGTSTGQ
jgi:hypothetical protein